MHGHYSPKSKVAFKHLVYPFKDPILKMIIHFIWIILAHCLIATSGFATTHVVVPVHCNEKLCFENILYISDANERQNQVPPGWTTKHAISC